MIEVVLDERLVALEARLQQCDSQMSRVAKWLVNYFDLICDVSLRVRRLV